MRSRVWLVLAAVPLLAGCVVGTELGDTAAGVTTEDINPQPVSALRDGGNLRISLMGYPQNFNVLNVDGNEGDTGSVVTPLLPSAYVSDSTGNVAVDHDYFTDIRLTGTSPQTVVFTINPRAVWSDGTPITWDDLQSEATAMSGHDPRYLVAGTTGFDRVASVTRGVDDRQAILAFAKPYGSWLGLFETLYPKSVTATPEAFNTAVRDSLPISAGPFELDSIDKVANRITLRRNPRWWGDRPRLDSITFTVLDPADWVTALQNNEVDATDYPLRTLAQVRSVQQAPDVVLRRDLDATSSNLTFNGAPGSVFADQALRLAVSHAVDRAGIARALLFGLTNNPSPVNNHLFPKHHRGYRDNAAQLTHDPARTAQELDALGWKLHGQWRERDGKRLEIRYATTQGQAATELAQIVQRNLADVGVHVDIETHPVTGFYSAVVAPGDFDIAALAWGGTPFPLASINDVYAYDPTNVQSNFGRIGSPEINALIDRVGQELDPDKAIALANEVDRKLFAEGFSVPLYQWAGDYPVRANVANYGAFGLATTDYTKIGFLK